MTVAHEITHFHGAPDDTVSLTYDARLLRRKKLVTDQGVPFLVDLAQTTSVTDHDAFVLEDGTQISVKDHWRERSDAGKFLNRVHRKACRLFSTTLGPDYDAAHADHFHLDMGSVETCR